MKKQEDQDPKKTSKGKETPLKKLLKALKYPFYVVLSFIIFKFLLALYNFRRDAAKINLTVRDSSDGYYMILAGLCHLVKNLLIFQAFNIGFRYFLGPHLKAIVKKRHPDAKEVRLKKVTTSLKSFIVYTVMGVIFPNQ